jgi:hypothetical protein
MVGEVERGIEMWIMALDTAMIKTCYLLMKAKVDLQNMPS